MPLKITATLVTKKQPLRDADVTADDTGATAVQVANWLARSLPTELGEAVTKIEVTVQEVKKDGTPKGEARVASPDQYSTYASGF